MKILLVEPDEYYHSSFTETIGHLGEIFLSRGALEEVKSILVEKEPDVLVMELLLPDQSGYELLETVRKWRQNRDLPIVIFSKVKNLEDIQESLNFGVSAYFVKGQDTVHDIKKLLLTFKDDKIS